MLKFLRLWLLAISSFVLILLTPLLSFSFSDNFYTKQLAPTAIQLSYFQNIQEFLLGKNQLTTPLTSDEKSHMNDVRYIFQSILYIEAIAFFVFLILAFSLYGHRGHRSLLIGIVRGAKINLGFSLLIVTLLLIDFQGTFVLFHKLFFPQGNWSFASNSLLLQIFPSYFFATIAQYIFFTSSGISLGLLIVSFFSRKYRKDLF